MTLSINTILPISLILVASIAIFCSLRKIFLGKTASLKQQLNDSLVEALNLPASEQKERLDGLIKTHRYTPDFFNPLSLIAESGVVRFIPFAFAVATSYVIGQSTVIFVFPFSLPMKLRKALLMGIPNTEPSFTGLSSKAYFIVISFVAFEIFNRFLKYTSEKEVRNEFVTKVKKEVDRIES
ncbi:hypothetical protein GEMRC1_013507 [Eukaryota sp. GEM-RC1]